MRGAWQGKYDQGWSGWIEQVSTFHSAVSWRCCTSWRPDWETRPPLICFLRASTSSSRSSKLARSGKMRAKASPSSFCRPFSLRPSLPLCILTPITLHRLSHIHPHTLPSPVCTTTTINYSRPHTRPLLHSLAHGWNYLTVRLSCTWSLGNTSKSGRAGLPVLEQRCMCKCACVANLHQPNFHQPIILAARYSHMKFDVVVLVFKINCFKYRE